VAAERNTVEDLRGAARLVVEATEGVTELVEAMHATIAGGPAILGSPLSRPVRAVTELIYGSIRGAARAAGGGLDAALARLAPHLGDGAPGPEREALLAALNGVLGDHLAATANPLAIWMRLRSGGRPLELTPASLRAALPGAGGRLLVLVHGSCLNDRQWLRKGHDHGAALARDLGLTPLYVHYNSGLHIPENGRALAGLLERVVSEWPAPVEELTLVAHSMGGLVARSACLAGEAARHRWRGALRNIAFLGTPHLGAPLEQGGSWADLLLGVSRYSAPFQRLARIRSAGVTDLRFGAVAPDPEELEEPEEGGGKVRDRFAVGGRPVSRPPLPEGVRCFALAGSLAKEGSNGLVGDGLVPVDSAWGRHADPALALGFPEARCWLGNGLGHLDLLDRPEVYKALRGFLAS
jgi:hypothetical protein